MQRAEYERLASARRKAPFQSLADFSNRVSLRQTILHQMAMGGVLDAFGLARRETLWEVLGNEVNRLGGLFQAAEASTNETPQLSLGLPGASGLFAPLTRWESIEQDLRTTGVFTSGHPVEELRRQNPGLPQITTREAKLRQQSRKLSVFGLVIVMQRPPTAKGTCFATLEDGDGFLDLIIRKEVFERSRELFESQSFLKVTGKLQRPGGRESHSASLLVDEIAGWG
jgi:DNA polymerase III alpha subunit